MIISITKIVCGVLLALWGIGTLISCRQDVYNKFSKISLDDVYNMYNFNPNNSRSIFKFSYLIGQIYQLFIMEMLLLAYTKQPLFLYPFVIYLIGYLVEFSQFLYLKHSFKYNYHRLIYSFSYERNIPNLVEDVSKGVAYVTMGIILIF